MLDYPHEGIAGRAECDISVDALIDATRKSGIPGAVASTLPELIPAEARARMIEAGVVPLQGLPEALAAIAASMRHAERRREILAQGGAALRVPQIGPLRAPAMVLDEARSKAELAAFGLPIPPAGRCARISRRGCAQPRLPGCGQGPRPFLPHKTEAGGVSLHLGSPEQVEEAIARMTRRLAAGGNGELRTVLVEPMVTDAVAELIVGVLRDERLGLALVIGGGGVLVELMQDSQRLLLPASREAIAQALSRLAVAKLLAGYRGRPQADIEAAIDAIAAVAAFAEAHRDRLAELDVNPLLVRPKGRGALAVDALIRMAPE